MGLNPPESLKVPAPGAVAGPLLKRALLSLAMLALPACLIPQNDPPAIKQPASRNHPVRILEALARPEFRTINTRNGAGCRIDFSVFVEDADVNDLLVARWYVDYDPQSNPSYYGSETPMRPGQDPVRPDSATLTLIPTSAGNPLATPKAHLVEVLVADGQLINRTPQQFQPEDSTAPKDTYYSAVWAWLVNVEPGDCE